MEYTIEQLVAAGGQVWQKNGMTRVYFNDMIGLYGLEVERYNTGNISSAKLDGETISNSEAKRIINKMGDKLWYDLADHKFHGRGFDDDVFQVLIDEIKRRMDC